MARPPKNKAKLEQISPKVPDLKVPTDRDTQHRCYKMWARGASFAEIAGELGITEREIISLVAKEGADRLAEIKLKASLCGPETVKAQIIREVDCLNDVFSKMWPNIERGNANAAAVGLKIVEMRSKLLDLFPSERHEHTLSGATHDEAKKIWDGLFKARPNLSKEEEPKAN